MTVHELVEALFSAGDWGDTEKINRLEAEIRQAVIAEASIGEITVEEHEGYLTPEPTLTWTASTKLKAGEYYLVPKESAAVKVKARSA